MIRLTKTAFTLIELVTVIVVLGILASIAMPAMLDYRIDAANSADEAVAAMLRDMSNRMRLQTIAQSGGDDTRWPDVSS